MCYSRSVRSQLSFVLAVLVFALASLTQAFADTSNPSADAQISSSTGDASASDMLQPQKVDDRVFAAERKEPNLVWAVYLFLLMIAVLAGLWVYQRKGGSLGKRIGATNDLKICETKPLGNRQFLVVVSYGEQKMLLGVAPGVINHLCYLEDPTTGTVEVPKASGEFPASKVSETES